jgi:hypothetical protein
VNKLIVIAVVILSGCAPMTPEQAARSDAAFQNMIYQKQMQYQRNGDYLRQQQLVRDQQPWPSQVNQPTRTTCKPNYLNPSQLDCVSR